jgi:hypothetical protein
VNSGFVGSWRNWSELVPEMMDGRALRIEKAVHNEGCEKYDRCSENTKTLRTKTLRTKTLRTKTGRTSSCLWRGCGVDIFVLRRRVFFGRRLNLGVHGFVLGHCGFSLSEMTRVQVQVRMQDEGE